MDVQINEMNTTVRATDSQTLLSQPLIEQLTRMLLARLRDEQAHDQRVEDGRRLRQAVSAREGGP